MHFDGLPNFEQGANRGEGKEEEKQIKLLKEEFDKKYGSLKDSNPELYAQLWQDKLEVIGKIRELDGEIRELNEELEWSNSEHEDTLADKKELEKEFDREICEANEIAEGFVADLEKAKVDPTTKLKMRRYFFDALKKDLSGLLGKEKEEISDKDWLAFFCEEEKDFRDVNMTVMMSDVSFLSLANKDGHYSGDSLLRKIGEIVDKENIDGYRYGGDEITSIFKLDYQWVQEKVKKLQEEINNSKNVSNLDLYKLKPHLDVGLASLDEAVTVFRTIAKDEEFGQEYLNKDTVSVLDEFEDVWVAIADKKAFIAKGHTRIALLVDRFKKDEDNYKKIIDYLRKGGYEISDGQVEDFAKKSGGDKKKLVNYISNFVLDKEQRMLKNKKGYEKTRDMAIAKHVGILNE